MRMMYLGQKIRGEKSDSSTTVISKPEFVSCDFFRATDSSSSVIITCEPLCTLNISSLLKINCTTFGPQYFLFCTLREGKYSHQEIPQIES